MFDNIVIPLDRSKLAEVALPYAEELAAKMGSDIVLLTVFESEDDSESKNYYRYIMEIKKATERYAEKYIDNEKSELNSINEEDWLLP